MINSSRIKLFFFLTGFLLACSTIISCTQCTKCEYYYLIPSTLDTVRGGQDFCGSNRTVKDFEEFYKADIGEKAGLANAIPVIDCVRSRKQ